jgi:hypothetical protein
VLGDVRQELAGAGYPDAEIQSFSHTNALAIRLEGTQQLGPQATKMVEECHTYITNNAGFILDYGARYRQGDRIGTGPDILYYV